LCTPETEETVVYVKLRRLEYARHLGNFIIAEIEENLVIIIIIIIINIQGWAI
jgi:hypothetical protein